MIIYIAGKMTGLEDYGREHFARAERDLRAEGHTVLNPACLPDDLPRAAYIPICLAMIDAAEAIYLLDNWPASRGACLEKAYAEYRGKTVWYEDVRNGKKLATCQDMMATLLEHIGDVIAL